MGKVPRGEVTTIACRSRVAGKKRAPMGVVKLKSRGQESPTEGPHFVDHFVLGGAPVFFFIGTPGGRERACKARSKHSTNSGHLTPKPVVHNRFPKKIVNLL